MTAVAVIVDVEADAVVSVVPVAAVVDVVDIVAGVTVVVIPLVAVVDIAADDIVVAFVVVSVVVVVVVDNATLMIHNETLTHLFRYDNRNAKVLYIDNKRFQIALDRSRV